VASRLSGTWPASRAALTPSGPSSRKRPSALARDDGRASLRAARTAGLLGLVITSTGAVRAARQALPLEPLESLRPWRALVTRLANVRWSVTAMSARTLRSTWMPARRSPEMNRL
jgi:hypothetical protein